MEKSPLDGRLVCGWHYMDVISACYVLLIDGSESESDDDTDCQGCLATNSSDF